MSSKKPLHVSSDPTRQNKQLELAIALVQKRILDADTYGARAEEPLSGEIRVAMEKILYAVSHTVEADPQHSG